MTDQKPDEMPAEIWANNAQHWHKHEGELHTQKYTRADLCAADKLAENTKGRICNEICERDFLNKRIKELEAKTQPAGADWFTPEMKKAAMADAVKVCKLHDTLRDVLKAVVSPENADAVKDTIWVNGTPIGDFIGGAIDEEVDVDALQTSPYRCKKTAELFPNVDLKMVREELENAAISFGDSFKHTELGSVLAKQINAAENHISKAIAHIDSVTGGGNG